jgi:impB/mucB/samB family protein
VTKNLQKIPLARDIALAIRAKIKQETGLNASAGISYNKLLAKLASDPQTRPICHPPNFRSLSEKSEDSCLRDVAISCARSRYPTDPSSTSSLASRASVCGPLFAIPSDGWPCIDTVHLEETRYDKDCNGTVIELPPWHEPHVPSECPTGHRHSGFAERHHDAQRETTPTISPEVWRHHQGTCHAVYTMVAAARGSAQGCAQYPAHYDRRSGVWR